MKKYKLELILTALIVAVLLLASCEKDRCKCYKVDVEIEYYPNPHIIKADTSRAYFSYYENPITDTLLYVMSGDRHYGVFEHKFCNCD